jgi:hypothetical protein
MKLNEENFLKDVCISTLKLRGGWGINRTAGYSYPSIPLFNLNSAQYQFGNTL